MSARHTNVWQSVRMAQTFVDLGFDVDVISLTNQRYVPEKPYDVLVDIGQNLQRLASRVEDGCLKIMHIEKANLAFQNAAESARLLALQRRRGVTLSPWRFEAPNLAIEHADCATTTGNEFTIETYRFAGKPIHRVPIPVVTSRPWPASKDFEKCRRSFLWFGSKALVHKGLDLVLEAFAAMPDFHLTVCGSVDHDRRFVKAYRKELHETPHIRSVGWVDIDSPRFNDLANECVALVYPSCSEGGGASAVSCLHAGLIPIVTRETSVDVHDFGFLLKGATPADVQDAVRRVAGLPSGELEARARRAWQYAQSTHTREHFAREYRRVIEQILSEHGK